VRLSLNITSYTWPDIAGSLAGAVRAADYAGLDTVWVSDHLLQAAPGTDRDEPMLEAYSTLGYLAGVTSRIRLGTMVAAATFRPPALLVKAVTTLDVLSGGRAWLGIGAGYHEQEAREMGLPLPPTRERFEQLEDTLRLALQLWSGDGSPFAGTRLNPGESAESFGERCAALAGLGIEHAVVISDAAWQEDAVAILAAGPPETGLRLSEESGGGAPSPRPLWFYGPEPPLRKHQGAVVLFLVR
jgi:alkanesulfonate monooxygenase SsuD/methylene tetrahydromethanopterin reductase-like flavin-dependent oxidoreductase (luciferase family)